MQIIYRIILSLFLALQLSLAGTFPSHAHVNGELAGGSADGAASIKTVTSADASKYGLQKSSGSNTLYVPVNDPVTQVNYAVGKDGLIYEVSSLSGFNPIPLSKPLTSSPNGGVKPAPVNGDKLVLSNSNPGTAQSRVNVAKVTDDNGNVRGFDYAIGKHGKNATTGSNKSKFSISDNEVRTLLQNKDVVKSPVYNVRNPVTGEIDPNKFGRQVDVGKNIGTTLVDGKTVKTSTVTIITNRRGNLINTFPGQF